MTYKIFHPLQYITLASINLMHFEEHQEVTFPERFYFPPCCLHYTHVHMYTSYEIKPSFSSYHTTITDVAHSQNVNSYTILVL